VNDTVIVSQREVHHVANGDNVVAFSIGADDWTLDDVTWTKDSDLWLVDDRSIKQRTEGTKVGNREGPTGQFVWFALAIASAQCQIGDRVRDTAQVQVACALDDWNPQSAFSVNGDADVFAVMVGDFLGFSVVLSVECRVCTQSFGRSLGN